MTGIATGLDQIEQEFWKELKGQSLGLLANQASVNRNLRSAKEIMAALLPGQVKILFGPQHGFRGEDQDNMIQTEDYLDPDLHIPALSLYGDKIGRLSHALDTIDVLVIDLQDVGTRVYTFISTMLSCLKEAAKAGTRVLILDRPNPLGGMIVEGHLLRPELYSLVGPFSLPMRHGMTMGELAYLFKGVFDIDCDMTVLSLKGWRRPMLWNDTGLRWVMPSPNMPLFETAQVYPGQVIWEGTNISEGRGTCRPFEIFGAPFVNPLIIEKGLPSEDTEGCYLQKCYFKPTFNKWEGQRCGGLMIHVLNRAIFRPYRTSLALLKEIMETCTDDFAWKEPPYEYEFEKAPIDLILGDSSVRVFLEEKRDIKTLLDAASQGLDDFLELRKEYLIYGDGE